MATATNRVTKEYREGITKLVNYPASHWIVDSAQAAALRAANVPSRYWNIVGDAITEMSPAEKVALDQAMLDLQRAETVARLDDVESLLRALMLVLLDEINLLRAASVPPLAPRTIAQLRTAIRNRLGS